MNLPKILRGCRIGLAFVSAAGLMSAAHASDCNPLPRDAVKLELMDNKLNTVTGKTASFDPCHRSVALRTPFFATKPPLMILVHGGAGLDEGTKNAANAFQALGMATLVFDAFEMNGFYQGPQFFRTAVTNEARQRMIYHAALGAYEWALRQDKIDNRSLFFHGLSNGAAAVVNLASVVDPRHVVALLAEGVPGNGLGFPDAVKAPLKLVFGRLDNYGGRTADEFIWLRQERCIGNTPSTSHPTGSSSVCNRLTNPDELTIKPIDWYGAQKAKGAPVDLWWLDETAHGIFIGPLLKNMVSYTNGSDRFAWVGGTHSARQGLLKSVSELLKQRRAE